MSTKAIIRSFLGVFVLPLILSSCTDTGKSGIRRITVSLAPQKYFIEQITEDFVEVHVLVPSGNNPEVYDPAPIDIAKLQQSVAYFAIGSLPFETEWLKALPKEVKVINQAELLPHDMVFCHDHEHAHVHVHGDPHYWTSVTGAKAMAEVMLTELIHLFPEQEQLFRENYKELIEEIEEVETYGQAVFGEKDNMAFVIYHPSLSLFANEWGLTQLVIEENGLEPTPRHLVHLMKTAKEMETKVVFIQKEFDVKNAENISKELALPLLTIQPMEENWKEEMMRLIAAFE